MTTRIAYYLLIKKWICISLLFVLPLTIFAQSGIINIVEKGADATGKTMVSSIINQQIDSLAQKSGGTIFIPAGNYLCGPIFLKSNITLHLDAGATLHFSDNFDDYLPMVQSRWEGVRVKTFASPIYAIDAHNVAIKGEGHFEGHGEKWWSYMYQIRQENISDSKWQKIFAEENKEMLEENEYLPRMRNFLRPPMVMFYNCNNVSIEGVSFSNPPFWTIVPTFSQNVTIHNVTIENNAHSPNTDGIDPSSCRNVHISDCHITVGDDCIVIKSGRDEDGRAAGVATENITITNCTMLNGHGGVVIGSEMSGGVKRVTISNCVFEGTDRGIRLKTMRGRGGLVEDVRVSNIVMRNIVKEGIMMNMRYGTTEIEPVSERTPQFRRIQFSNINIVEAKRGIAIYGLEERSVEQVSFTDLYIEAEQGIYGNYANNLIFDNIRLETPSTKPLEFVKCNNISINQFSLLKPVENTTAISLEDCQMIRLSNCFQTDSVSLFLKADQNCKNIYLINNVLPGVEKVIDLPSMDEVTEINTVH